MKLSPQQREEVNHLMEEAQDDLEGVLFKLVFERDKAIEENLKLRKNWDTMPVAT